MVTRQSAVRSFRETANGLSESSILYPWRACVMGLARDNCHVKDSQPWDCRLGENDELVL